MSSEAPADDTTYQPTQDDSYVSRTGQKDGPVPVQSDSDPVDEGVNPATADSDETLERDEKDAIDESNILDGDRTRGAAPKGGYREPGDEEGLPGPEDE